MKEPQIYRETKSDVKNKYLETVEMEDKIINNLQVVCHQEFQWHTEMGNK